MAWSGVLFGVLCLWLIEASTPAPVRPLVQIARPPRTRLVVLLVDSLSVRDVEAEGAMPLLRERLARGALHGPVEPCADAITVPCIAATITGRDRLSVFALGSNFAGTGGLVEDSVLGQLQRVGVRTGYFGEPMLAKPLQGIASVVADLRDDDELVDALELALTRSDLQVYIAHFRALDQASHEHGGSAPEYARVRLHVDQQVDALIARTLPTDHVLVMGDHGHTIGGRHAAGLETTSYAAYFGPQFSRSARVFMHITDHAAVWAHIFGFSRAPPAWLNDYHAGAALRPTSGGGIAPSRLPVWAAALVALIACWLCLAASSLRAGTARGGALPVFAASVLGMAALGALWPTLRSFTWQSGTRIRIVSTLCVIATGSFGALALRWLSSLSRADRDSRETRYARLLSASVVFAIPTVYWMGGPNVAQTWLCGGTLAQSVWFARRGRARLTVCSLASALIVLSLTPVKLANYVLRGFTVYTKHIPELSKHALPLLAAGYLLSALILGRLLRFDRRGGWFALTAGFGMAACVGVVPGAWFLLPCALAYPCTWLALARPALTPFSVMWALPATWFFFDASIAELAPLLAVWLLFALVPRVLREHGHALRGAALLVLIVMSFRSTMGCRITGIDFEFFVHFLPPGTDVTTHWFAQTVLTALKYLLPPTFGVLIARASDPELGQCLWQAVLLARARIGLCLCFLGALAVAQPGAGAVLIGDATQEVAFWVFVLAALGLLSCTLRSVVTDERL